MRRQAVLALTILVVMAARWSPEEPTGAIFGLPEVFVGAAVIACVTVIGAARNPNVIT